MIRKCAVIFVLFFTMSQFVFAASRPSSWPYISGDTFRKKCDILFDETTTSFDPLGVQPGNIIFVKTDLLDQFFSTKHPYIPCRYILVTHNSDCPSPGSFAHMLDDGKIIAWFAQNTEDYTHPKLYPIPIGLANRHWPHGRIEDLEKAIGQIGNKRKWLVYMNFTTSTFPTERNLVYNLFRNKPYCKVSKPKKTYKYLLDLAQSKFVLSPRGNGLDCHRTWEALYMGAIPIVKSSTLDSVFDGLPVLIIQDWNDITEEFLHAKYQEIESRSYHLERLMAPYWVGLMEAMRIEESDRAPSQ